MMTENEKALYGVIFLGHLIEYDNRLGSVQPLFIVHKQYRVNQ